MVMNQSWIYIYTLQSEFLKIHQRTTPKRMMANLSNGSKSKFDLFKEKFAKKQSKLSCPDVT